MSQLNFNVSGWHGDDAPMLSLDSGGTYRGTFESAGRFLVILPPTVSGGATVQYQHGAKSFRVIVPPGPGSWEAGADPCIPPEYHGDGSRVVLAYASRLARLEPDGVQFKGYVWKHMTGFCDYALWCRGQRDVLEAVWDQAIALGATGRRVLGMMAYITHFDPREYTHYYSELQPFALAAAEKGLRLHFDVFADNQVYNLGLAHWAQVCDQLRPIESVVIGLGNEWPKNGFNPNAFPYPGVISSQGSSTSDAAPPMPGWGIRCFHGRRDYPKVFMSFDDAVYVGRGLDASGHQYAPVAPVVHDEPMGFAEVDVPGRRSTDPVLAQSLMLTGRAYGAGATFHSEDGMFSRLLGPIQQTCARAFFDVA